MKRALVQLGIVITLLITTVSIATPTHWREIKPGIEYTQIKLYSGFHSGVIHAFRIDLSQYQLELAVAEDQRSNIATVSDLAIAKQGIIGINGGFFSQELKPLGLRISNYKQHNPLKSITWWSVFYILDQHPYIVSQKLFRPIKQIQFAIQSGPRLIINGKIPSTLKAGGDYRSAIGITKNNRVLLVATQNLSLTMTEFARVMQLSEVDGGLGCANALNLDGGNSSQLYASIDNFSLYVPGYSAVTDAILVIPKRESKRKPLALANNHHIDQKRGFWFGLFK